MLYYAQSTDVFYFFYFEIRHMSQSLRDHIVVTFGDVYLKQTGLNTLPILTDETVLLETGLDSLGFAVLVVTLEQELGFDPFLLSEDAYYPRTFGEFVRFYETNSSQ